MISGALVGRLDYFPAFGGPVEYSAALTSDDPDQQVADSIGIMRGLVLRDCHSPEIHQDLRSATNDDGMPDPIATCDAIWAYTKSKITFAEDRDTAQPLGIDSASTPVVETFVPPAWMSRICSDGSCQRTGDCDDFSMYAAALLTAAGIPAKFATVAADSQAPDQYSHVYVVAYPNGQRYPLDCSHGHAPGWEVPNVYGKRCEWDVQTGATSHSSGLMGFLISAAILAGLIWGATRI